MSHNLPSTKRSPVRKLSSVQFSSVQFSSPTREPLSRAPAKMRNLAPARPRTGNEQRSKPANAWSRSGSGASSGPWSGLGALVWEDILTVGQLSSDMLLASDNPIKSYSSTMNNRVSRLGMSRAKCTLYWDAGEASVVAFLCVSDDCIRTETSRARARALIFQGGFF